jgi:hypothetical protein
MTSALLDVLPEILEEYVKHWNLLDLSALLRTSKIVAMMMSDINLIDTIIRNQL